MKSTSLYALSLAVGMFLTLDLSAQNAAKAPFKSIKKFELPKSLKNTEYLPKTIVFKVSPQFRGGAGLNSIQHPELQLALNYLGVAKLEKKFPRHKQPEKEKNEYGQKYADLSLIYQLTYTNDVDIERAANQLLASGALVYAEPHYIYKLTDYQPNDPKSDSTLTDNTLPLTDQHNMFKRIRAYKAWDLSIGGSRGDANTVIGIVDSGSDLDHPDLAANIYHNAADPIDGNDNDGDGYVDNYDGWDLGGADYNAIVEDNNPNCLGANNNHGSHVSGCASEVSDNGVGGAGIGFNCKLLIVKAAADNDTRGSGGVGYIIGGYEGITYAADHGAHIINCSWGGEGGGSFGQDVINYATINKNSLVVAAAGNDGSDLAYYPASYTYVLSVGATKSTTDGKASFSNYNYTVDIGCPGESIYSTIYNNNYSPLDGTSMASPIVAGAAGLVKSKYPSYTAMQIGQRLKQTTDNNYAAYNATTNPNITSGGYISQSALRDKMGTGRLNAFRALTDAAKPSVVFQNESVVDNNDQAIVIGDTIFITGEFFNYLEPTSGSATASIRATANGTSVTVVDSTTTLGVLGTMGSTNNNADPFKFVINPGTAENTVVTFRVLIKDGSYYSKYFVNVTVNVDYINMYVNDLQTTITSKSKIGWNQDGATQGLGFKYLGTQMLYESGLMIGTSTTAVSDRIRGADGSTSDADFVSALNVSRVIPTVQSEFDAHGKFHDVDAVPTQNLMVTHNAYAWSTPGHRKYIIVEYFIKNTGTNALTNLYAGIGSDWDIPGPANGATDYAKNKADYDATRKMGYAWFSGANGKYAGIKVLNNEAGNHYGIDNTAGGAGGLDINDAGNYYSTEDKYTALSTFRAQAGFADADGEDVLNVVSTGPFNVNSGDSVKVAFALICGDDLADIQESADSAQSNYNSIYPVGLKSVKTNSGDIRVYPNPASSILSIAVDNNEGYVGVELFNMIGQKVMTVSYENMQDVYTIDLSSVPEGVYLYKVVKGKDKDGGNTSTNKLTIGKIIVTRSNK